MDFECKIIVVLTLCAMKVIFGLTAINPFHTAVNLLKHSMNKFEFISTHSM